MSVQFGDNDGSNVHFVFEGPGLEFARLANGGIHDEDHVVRFLDMTSREDWMCAGLVRSVG